MPPRHALVSSDELTGPVGGRTFDVPRRCEPRGLLGLGVLGTFLASLVSSAWLLQPVFRVMAVAVVALIAGSSYALRRHAGHTARWWVAAAVVATGALVSMVVGIAGAATQVSGRAVVLAGWARRAAPSSSQRSP